MTWSVESTFMRKSKTGTVSRPAFKDEHGVIFLPPKNTKNIQPWFNKHDIPESLRTSYLSSIK